jgi:hypothetical protein
MAGCLVSNRARLPINSEEKREGLDLFRQSIKDMDNIVIIKAELDSADSIPQRPTS